MVTPLCVSNGARDARKSCCSVLVHSAQRVADPPTCEVEGELEPLPPEPPQAPTASTTAAPAATRPTFCTCFIETSSLAKSRSADSIKCRQAVKFGRTPALRSQHPDASATGE